MSETLTSVEKHIEAIALSLITLDGEEDLPVMGEMLNHLNELKPFCTDLPSDRFKSLVSALEQYLERIVLRETDDFKPFELGLEYLQACFRSICNQVDYTQDLTAVFQALGTVAPDNGNGKREKTKSRQDKTGQAGDTEDEAQDASDEANNASAPGGIEVSAQQSAFDAPQSDMDDEDREIVSGFVMESLDGLGTVEVSLMELEQNPGDKECINAIFRAFHTIKGVSSFLGFMRINHLAHKAENLLDAIRCGDLEIEPDIVDIILDAVDLLKQLIEGVRNGMDTGAPLDIGLDVAELVARIESVRGDESDTAKPLGQILVDQGVIRETELETALDTQKKDPQKKIGEILVASGAADDGQVASALKEQEQVRKRNKKAELQVKVDTVKLDNLVDLAGELVIAQSMLRQHPHISTSADQRLMHTLGQLNQITSSLQTMSMSMRMVPIKSTFQKMLRLVRDLARSSGKQVRLSMQGEETEIDRNVVDELYEPMVHMIRNSVDHGLEIPQERQRAGKDPCGSIHLKAFHRGGNIIVEICDDGRGLDKQRILAKAKAGGLIGDESKLNDDEIYNLIFSPGFSTAETVSSISGRGVGMDVVKKAIEKLRGRVDIQTEPGKGSIFTISLPLTLAIIEGMLVRVGDERYVIPALAIIESFRPTQAQCSTVEGKGEMILSRDRLIPLVRLGTLFGHRCDVDKPWEGLVVTVEYDGKYVCLLLDELLGKEEVVIKSMGKVFKSVKGIAGGAIMGDGRVGLIMDMAGIWQLAMG